jgi:hypothetical protein
MAPIPNFAASDRRDVIMTQGGYKLLPIKLPELVPLRVRKQLLAVLVVVAADQRDVLSGQMADTGWQREWQLAPGTGCLGDSEDWEGREGAAEQRLARIRQQHVPSQEDRQNR